MDKVKILFIHHGIGIGGALISMINLIKNLDKDKYEAKVGLLQGGISENILQDYGIDFEVIDASRAYFAHAQTGKIQWYHFLRYIKIYRSWQNTAKEIAPAYLKTQDADIVHLNSHVLTDWAYAAHRAGKKVVLHNREAVARGYLGFRHRILKRLIEENCDYIINISEDNLNRLGIKDKACVIYNFVDIPAAYRPSMSEPREKIKVLYLGGTSKIKGYKTVVECLPHLNDNIIFQFAGGTLSLKKGKSLKEKIIYLIKIYLYPGSYGLFKKVQESRNVEILGLLQRPLPVIDACDIMVTPFKIEHFSRPAVEAFAYGKPVIGSDVVGMNEIISHNINGLLVKKNDPEALATAINSLSRQPELARQMGKNGREKAVQLFSPDKNTRQVEAVYNSLIS